jgi:CheY-like chemotaxis protein
MVACVLRESKLDKEFRALSQKPREPVTEQIDQPADQKAKANCPKPWLAHKSSKPVPGAEIVAAGCPRNRTHKVKIRLPLRFVLATGTHGKLGCNFSQFVASKRTWSSTSRPKYSIGGIAAARQFCRLMERGCHMSAKILIVDDSPAIRRSLRSLFTEQTDWTIVGEAENGRVAIEKSRELKPDVIILDLSMPVMNGLDAARKIRESLPNVSILLFTMHAYPQLTEAARNVGVNKVVSKSDDPARLLGAVPSLLKG